MGLAKKAETDLGKKRFVNTNGFEFTYHTCWQDPGAADDEENGAAPTRKCPAAEQGTWQMGIGVITDVENVTAEQWMDTRKSFRDVVAVKNVKIGNIDAKKYAMLTPEESKIIDEPHQNNYFWTVVFKCGKGLIGVNYLDQLDKAGREKARKNPMEPEVFKEVAASLRCTRK